MGTILFLVIVVVLILWVVSAYNGLISLKNQTVNAWKQIDVQLKRRHDLIPNLVNTVKGSMNFEKDTLDERQAANPALKEKRDFLDRLPHRLSEAIERLKQYDFEDAEARQAFENLKGVLEDSGSALEHVVKTTCFLIDLADFQVFNEHYGRRCTVRAGELVAQGAIGRVVQTTGCFGLAEETRPCLGQFGAIELLAQRHRLDRHLAADLRVVAQVHRAHRAAPELAVDAVAAERGAVRCWGCGSRRRL